MVTLRALCASTAKRLSAAGIPDAGFEANELVRSLSGLSREKLLMGGEADESLARRVEDAVSERLSGRPLQYIIGEWEFYGLRIKVGEGVLIPRPETELLVELAAPFLHKGSVCLDLCAGSGCIGLALNAQTGCAVFGIERSDAALRYFEENVALNHAAPVTPVKGDIFASEIIAALPHADVIVTNPPYLSDEDFTRLQREVGFEPREALSGGADGLVYYRRIFSAYKPLLKSGGLFAAEIGDGQEQAVSRLMREAGFSPEQKTDLNGIVRIIYAVNR